MISKNIIVKSIDEAIEKCSKPKYFSNVTREYFKQFHEESKDLDYEIASFLDRNGDVIWESDRNKGESKKVRLNKKFIMDNIESGVLLPGEVDVIHNHPVIPGFEHLNHILSSQDVRACILTGTYNDELCFRSNTSMGPDGESMSIIMKRDNDIVLSLDTDEGSDKFANLLKAKDNYAICFDRYLNDYIDKISEYTKYDVEELYSFFKKNESWSESPDSYEVIHNHIVEDIGEFQDYLEKDGVIKEFDDLGYIFRFS